MVRVFRSGTDPLRGWAAELRRRLGTMLRAGAPAQACGKSVKQARNCPHRERTEGL